VNCLSPRLARQAAVEEVDLLTMAIKAGLLIDTVCKVQYIYSSSNRKNHKTAIIRALTTLIIAL
jgi:hypothetical protein